MNEPRAIERWSWLPSLQQAPDLHQYQSPEDGAAFVRDHNIRALLWTWESEGADWVAAIHDATGVPICPVVPNMATYARDTRDKGFVGAALQRLLALPWAAQIRIGLGAAPLALDVLAKDFATGACILAEMEIARFRPFKPRAAFLNSQMGDLALAFDNGKLFKRFGRLAGKRYHLEIGFMTNNFGHLAPQLKQWGTAVDHILTPFNPKGYLMYPDGGTCEAGLDMWRERVIAADPTAGGTIEREKSDQRLIELGIRRALINWPLADTRA